MPSNGDSGGGGGEEGGRVVGDSGGHPHQEMSVDAEAAAVVQSHTVLHLRSGGVDSSLPISRPGTQLTAKIGKLDRGRTVSRPSIE